MRCDRYNSLTVDWESVVQLYGELRPYISTTYTITVSGRKNPASVNTGSYILIVAVNMSSPNVHLQFGNVSLRMRFVETISFLLISLHSVHTCYNITVYSDIYKW